MTRLRDIFKRRSDHRAGDMMDEADLHDIVTDFDRIYPEHCILVGILLGAVCLGGWAVWEWLG